MIGWRLGVSREVIRVGGARGRGLELVLMVVVWLLTRHIIGVGSI
jgi:hypothetical protein